jgi:hypothetical protein
MVYYAGPSDMLVAVPIELCTKMLAITISGLFRDGPWQTEPIVDSGKNV